jgi:hypothetical protein
VPLVGIRLTPITLRATSSICCSPPKFGRERRDPLT